eukprot:3103865-Rhodomonas_salina.2
MGEKKQVALDEHPQCWGMAPPDEVVRGSVGLGDDETFGVEEVGSMSAACAGGDDEELLWTA